MDKEKIIEEQCGILFDIVFIDNGTALYLPKYTVEGSLGYNSNEEKYYFIDKYGNEFAQIDDADIFAEKNGECVGYIISKKELADTYREIPFEEAVSQYYSDISGKVYFGFYTIDENCNTGVICKELDLSDITVLSDNLAEGLSSSAFNSSISHSNSTTQTQGISIPQGEVAVLFTKDDIETLMNATSLDEVHNLLKGASDLLLDKKENSYFTEGGSVEKFVEDYGKQLNSCESLEDMRTIIGNINIELVRFALEIDAKKEKLEGLQFQFDEEKILTSLIDHCIDLRELEDVSLMRVQMYSTLQKEKEHLEKLFAQYLQAVDLEKELIEKEPKYAIDEKLNIREMKSFLDASVIGQEEAKRKIISSFVKNSLSDDYQNKSIGLLIGPTGSGKTLILKTLKKYLNKPMVIIDSTQLTMQGYIGYGVEDFLGKLLEQTNGDRAKAEEGIVVFDEIDKKGSEKNQDVSGKGVLNMLLSFMEGTDYSVKYKGMLVPFNTEKLKIYATGSFAEVVRELNGGGGYKTSRIGFGSTMEQEVEDIVYPHLTLEDLSEIGNMPAELLGRISMIVQLHGHTTTSLKAILMDSNVSPWLSELAFFEKLNISLCCTEPYLDKVVEKALALKTGARSLKRIIEESVVEARLEAVQGIFDGREYVGVVLTENTVDDPQDCIFIDAYQNQVNLKNILEEEQNKIKSYTK